MIYLLFALTKQFINKTYYIYRPNMRLHKFPLKLTKSRHLDDLKFIYGLLKSKNMP